jgi:precorrin-6A/cobalt-precorrin-6A reductase
LGYTVIYSVVGLTTPPKASFVARSGGFGGVDGLADYLRARDIGLLIDATHPYAATISIHARDATRRCGLPYWALRRPPWSRTAGVAWEEFQDWTQLVTLLAAHQRPLFTIGREPLKHLAERPTGQIWLIRCLDGVGSSAGVCLITARGPFTLASELELMSSQRIDALICKNSGGEAVAAKLQVAARLGIPVLMQRRPRLPSADREFGEASSLVVALERLQQ